MLIEYESLDSRFHKSCGGAVPSSTSGSELHSGGVSLEMLYLYG